MNPGSWAQLSGFFMNKNELAHEQSLINRALFIHA